MANDKKIINDFTKLISRISNDNEKTSHHTKEILALSNEQLKTLRNLVSSASNFQAVQTDQVFESQSAEEKIYEKMIKQEEKRASKEDENFDDLLAEQEKMLKELEETNKETKKQNKEKKKTTTTKKESERVDFGGMLTDAFSIMSKLILDVSGISQFMSVFGGIKDMIVSPFKTIGKYFPDKKDIISREKKESRREEMEEYNQSMLESLQEIEGNTRKEEEMVKGGSLSDFFKKFMPAGLFGGASGIAGKAGGMLKKTAGAGMIIGGLWLAVEDFMEGFKEGGIGKGLYRAFVGKSEGTIMGGFKNAGKWALIGAGIGSFVPVMGTIAGGLIGGSIGLLMNYVAGLVKSDAPIGDKITSVLFGSGSGILASVFHGSKFAVAGALIGSFVPVIGTIAGGLIGFVVGFLIDFVRQIIPSSVKSKLSNLVSWMGEKLSGAWDWTMEKLSGAWDSIKSGLSSVADSLGLTSLMNSAQEKLSALWTIVSDAINPFFDWVGNFIGKIWNEIKSITVGLWDRTKKWFSFGSDSEEKKQSKKVASKEQETMSLGMKSFNANIETAQTIQKVSKEAPKQSEISETGNTLLESIGNELKAIHNFFSENFMNSFEAVLENANENMKSFFMQQAEINRAWEFAAENGSLSGYAGRYENFANDLETIRKTKQERESLEQSFNQVNNNNTNNIFSEASVEKRRSFRKGK